jgi:hypothetical protein
MVRRALVAPLERPLPSIRPNPTQARPGALRQTLGLLAFAALAAIILWRANVYLNHPVIPRPHDFVQVWSAGKLTLAGESPYDAKKVLDLQNEIDLKSADRTPRRYASMMWVPPWGLSVSLPIAVLPVPLAQAVWVFGQIGLILLSALMLWRLNGGRSDHWWVVVILVFSSGPVFWQSAVGQYAGILLFGIVGYLFALKANRPILAGMCLALSALKPHLFVFFAVGLLIDAARSSIGRRVVLGGAIGLTAGAVIATIASPGIWGHYFTAITGDASPYAPGLSDWFNPTISAWIRFAIPGHAFWIQVIPCVIATIGFGVYWWRRGNPNSWPETLNWVIPAGLLMAPYGNWPSDLTLMLIPITSVAAGVAARGWAVPGKWRLAVAYVVTNLLVVAMFVTINDNPLCFLISDPVEGDLTRWGREVKANAFYVWLAPMICGCLLWAKQGINPQTSLTRVRVKTASGRFRLQHQPNPC